MPVVVLIVGAAPQPALVYKVSCGGGETRWRLLSATRSGAADARARLPPYKPATLRALPGARTKGRAFGDRVFRERTALQKPSRFEVTKVSAG